MAHITTAQFQAGVSIAFGAVTNAFVDLVTFQGSVRRLIILSTLDQPVALTFNGANENQLIIPAAVAATGMSWTIPVDLGDTHYSGTIKIKYVTGATTAGQLTIFAVRGA